MGISTLASDSISTPRLVAYSLKLCVDCTLIPVHKIIDIRVFMIKYCTSPDSLFILCHDEQWCDSKINSCRFSKNPIKNKRTSAGYVYQNHVPAASFGHQHLLVYKTHLEARHDYPYKLVHCDPRDLTKEIDKKN